MRRHVYQLISDLIQEFGKLSDCDWRIKKTGDCNNIFG